VSESNQVVDTKLRNGINGIPLYRVRCPYCSKVNTFQWQDGIEIFGAQASKVLTCHSDYKEHDWGACTAYGGCGRSYAFFPSVEIAGETKKIEGEEA